MAQERLWRTLPQGIRLRSKRGAAWALALATESTHRLLRRRNREVVQLRLISISADHHSYTSDPEGCVFDLSDLHPIHCQPQLLTRGSGNQFVRFGSFMEDRKSVV